MTGYITKWFVKQKRSFTSWVCWSAPHQLNGSTPIQSELGSRPTPPPTPEPIWTICTNTRHYLDWKNNPLAYRFIYFFKCTTFIWHGIHQSWKFPFHWHVCCRVLWSTETQQTYFRGTGLVCGFSLWPEVTGWPVWRDRSPLNRSVPTARTTQIRSAVLELRQRLD